MLIESRRLQSVQSPIIPVVGELIRSHPGTISLGQGVVSYGPPRRAIERISDFLANPDNHKYGAVYGIPELLSRIESKLRAENGIGVEVGSRVVVTSGGNMAFVNALLAIADPGDEVILNVPFYFNHEMAIEMASCRAVLVPTDGNYQLQPDLIERAITSRTRAVVTISPNNPTGALYPESLLRRVNELCRERGLYHISDEAYEYFTYGGAAHFSPGSIDGAAGHTISLYSLSKAYGFASWRIGYMVIPDHLFEAVNKIQDTILICPTIISQYAATGALEAGRAYAESHVQELAGVRSMVLDRLSGVPDLCEVPPSGGAFYFLIRVRDSIDPLELVRRLVADHRVAAIPGTAFGIDPAKDGCRLRVAYGALRRDTVEEGVGRLVEGLKAIVKSRR